MSGSLHACLTVPRFAVQEVAQRLQVETDRPLVVANGTSGRATVIDLSDSALQHGIRPGMLVWEARRRCSTLWVAVHDPAAIAAAGIQVTDVLVQHTDDIHEERPGRWTFSLRALGHACAKVATIGTALCAEVMHETGYRCHWPRQLANGCKRRS